VAELAFGAPIPRERDVRFPAGSSIALHLRAGTLRLVLPDLGRRELNAGDWALLRTRNARFSASSGARALAFAVPAGTLETWFGPEETIPGAAGRLGCFVCPRLREPAIVAGAGSNALEQAAAACRFSGPDGPAGRLRFEARCLACLAELLRQPELAQGTSCAPFCGAEDAERIRSVADHLATAPEQPHSLRTLAARFHINEFKLKTGFKAIHGTTVFNYLREVRADRAAELLRNGACTVLEAANAVGYANPSHFARAFRRRHGLSPKAYQSWHRGM